MFLTWGGHRKKAFQGSFRHRRNVKSDKIEATSDKGILRVNLPKVEEAIVLHVLDERGIDAMARYASGSYDGLIRRIQKEAREEGEKVEAASKKTGFEVKVRIETGIPLTEILKVEEQEGVSAIVIGSHGKTNLEEMLLGPVSEKVIRKSKTPVLVIKR